MVVVEGFDWNFSLSPYIVVTTAYKLFALDIEKLYMHCKEKSNEKNNYFDQVGSGRYI